MIERFFIHVFQLIKHGVILLFQFYGEILTNESKYFSFFRVIATHISYEINGVDLPTQKLYLIISVFVDDY
jgi:hypothetical protein